MPDSGDSFSDRHGAVEIDLVEPWRSAAHDTSADQGWQKGNRLNQDESSSTEEPASSTARKRAVVLLVVSSAGLLMALVALFVPIPFWGRTATAVGDMVHAPLFGGLTLGGLCVLHWFRPVGADTRSLLVRAVAVWIAVSILGIAIEVVQQRFGRSGTLHDAVANSLGIMAAAMGFSWWSIKRNQPARRWFPRSLLAGAIFCVGLSWWTPTRILADVVRMHLSFPMLASFESTMELDRFYFRDCFGKRTRKDATDGQFAMEVTYEPTEHPAATLTEFKHDWTSMKSLELDIVLDENYPGNGQFMLKVMDKKHRNHNDAYRGQWTLVPGQPIHLSISREEIENGPDGRLMDLTCIQFVDLLMLRPVQFAKVRFDNLHLDR